VTDLAAAHVLALDSLVSGGASAVYNLGSGRPTSVRQVLDAVKRVTGKAVPYSQGPRRPGDPAVLYASSERIKKDLGWTPRYEDIDTIVETAWHWREAHPSGYRLKAGR
jgi:UDP-glucose 4-epimerase